MGRPTAGQRLSKSGMDGSTPSRPAFRWRVAQWMSNGFRTRWMQVRVLSRLSYGRKLNRKSTGVLTRGTRVRIAPGRFIRGEGGAMVAHGIVSPGAAGSSPVLHPNFDAVAKTERRRTANPSCAGSIPARVSIIASEALWRCLRLLTEGAGFDSLRRHLFASARKRAFEALLAKHRILTPGSGVQIPTRALSFIAGSSSGRTAEFGSAYVGSNPAPAANAGRQGGYQVGYGEASSNGRIPDSDSGDVGSSPAASTNYARVVQRLERLAYTQDAGGSSPSARTIFEGGHVPRLAMDPCKIRAVDSISTPSIHHFNEFRRSLAQPG
jgi:hypothetical protein